uniref:Patatin like phospholipase domain containing 4 n=1 Tax=Molossus molossus TaxID=27622 RepID=A0A7J8J8Y4_MOLMO|nr:patatin like phospholipase domain containing 4 [Molossus molossus]
MKGINLSFSACGFLGIYHLGAASALCRHGQKLLKDVQAFAGASAGSLVASVLLTAPEKLEVLCASSFVPIYAGLRAVEYRGQKWVDGGLTDSLPILPGGRTVTVSPFTGRLDISPQDDGRLGSYVRVANQDVLVSPGNLVRLSHALFPPSRREMESLHQRGFEDALRFLRRENWFE